MTKTRLVLWDIDHTLVDFTGLGSAWYATALAATTGTELVTYPDFGGRTERAISTDLLTAHGLEPTEELIQALWLALIAESERSVAQLPASARALPGAAEALTDFAGHDGVVQSLVTGNLPEISRHKLVAFGLHEHLDLEIGGYGTLSAHRPDLVPHAVARAAAKHGTEFDAVVVIGDTPNDVEAALDHGAVAVAVATGHYTAEELQAAGAHTVLPDLADTDAVRAAVLG
ncbi:haloacid dehalogenase-like hydrolase [Amycolatopsis sp. OK19-0408]|uniref:Haloacid dehalogenase-like hydrolase n=1 Tax=Amycolatopsis iheyensis TaxID=2945988 RepID=A0A9X2SJX2_9PSEU|nr:haloacid dehalogenase-like hydrolase [Amycolatopsis iheyensis]MCR6484508.1 haloacid dehalogenase-like hydrolase [Amycolatopsis iheyensis]